MGVVWGLGGLWDIGWVMVVMGGGGGSVKIQILIFYKAKSMINLSDIMKKKACYPWGF